MIFEALLFSITICFVGTQFVSNNNNNNNNGGRQTFQPGNINNQIANLVASGAVDPKTLAPVCTIQMQNQIRDVCARQLSAYGVFSPVATTNGQISPNSMTWDRLRRQSRDLFQEICRAFEDWDRCVSTYKLPCWNTEPIKGEFTVAHEALAYVCRDPAYSDMLTQWDCLFKTSQRSSLILCDAQILQNAKMGKFADLRQGNVACAVLQDYVGCIRTPIVDQCGPKSWNHVREAFQRPTNVYLPYCTLGASSLRGFGWPIVLIVVLVKMLLI